MVGHGGGRVASLVRVGGRNVGFDLRFPGDGYYPQEWAKRMLRDREPIPGAKKKQKTRKRKEKHSTLMTLRLVLAVDSKLCQLNSGS